jgi:hypothetical protein
LTASILAFAKTYLSTMSSHQSDTPSEAAVTAVHQARPPAS